MEIVDKSLLLARELMGASRNEPVYFTFKSHTFMTEGNFTYALCYNKRYHDFVFIKCEIKDESNKFIDKHKQIPILKLKSYRDAITMNRELNQKFFTVDYVRD